MSDLGGPEQLHLMSQCRANIITNSSYSWWRAWLNDRSDRNIVSPSKWCRPGVPTGFTDILCDDWVKICGTTLIQDHFDIWQLRHPLATVRRIHARFGS